MRYKVNNAFKYRRKLFSNLSLKLRQQKYFVSAEKKENHKMHFSSFHSLKGDQSKCFDRHKIQLPSRELLSSLNFVLKDKNMEIEFLARGVSLLT